MYNKIKPQKLEQVKNFKVTYKKVSPKGNEGLSSKQRKLKK